MRLRGAAEEPNSRPRALRFFIIPRLYLFLIFLNRVVRQPNRRVEGQHVLSTDMIFYAFSDSVEE